MSEPVPKESRVNADEPTGPAPIAIIGMGCLFPKADQRCPEP